MKRFSAIYVIAGSVRRMSFEALDLADAEAQAVKWGVGVEGEAAETAAIVPSLPVAYDMATARRLLGNVSARTIYRWLRTGELERVSECSRVLITRRSVERRAGMR